MTRMKKPCWILLAALLCGWAPLRAAAPAAVRWSGKDLSGALVNVPAETGPTAMLFAQADQPQSARAAEELKLALAHVKDVRVVAVVSGKDAAAGAKKLSDNGRFPWPIVTDEDYASSGMLDVHAWPTTLVIDARGRQTAHIAGVPKTFARDLETHLAYAVGSIDEAELKRRLGADDAVLDSAQQVAERHLRVARRLLEKGLADQARLELEAGLKHQPRNNGLQLALVEAMLSGGDAKAANALLDTVDSKAAPGWKLKLLRGRALVKMEQWDDALGVLQQAVQLNPDPAEAFYELGRVHQHRKDWQRAAECFRRAFETTPSGKKIAGERTRD